MALALTIAEQAVNKNLQDITLLQQQAKQLFDRISDQMQKGIATKQLTQGKGMIVVSATPDEINAAWQATGRVKDLEEIQTTLAPLLT